MTIGGHRRLRQLPPGMHDFTGRTEELAQIAEIAGSQAHRPAVVVVTGTGGVGKTALAVHAGRLLGEDFDDAHLFADLHGHSGEPATAAGVLGRFLRSLGVTEPDVEDADVEEIAALFRTTLAGRRCLVVLDDALNETQVRPLLPPGPDSLTVVTSRNWLGGLAGSSHMRLSPMSAEEGSELLARILGEQRAGEDPEAAAELLSLCGYLPLTIRIAAARLTSRPASSVRDLRDQLRDEGRRLRRLTAGDTTISAVLTSSYDGLAPCDRAVFRRLVLLPGLTFDAAAVAVVAGFGRREVEESLERLADCNMVLAESAPRRFSLHSLARLFARDMLRQDEDPGAIAAAEQAVRDWILGWLEAAAAQVSHTFIRLPRPADDRAPSADAAGGPTWTGAAPPTPWASPGGP